MWCYAGPRTSSKWISVTVSKLLGLKSEFNIFVRLIRFKIAVCADVSWLKHVIPALQQPVFVSLNTLFVDSKLRFTPPPHHFCPQPTLTKPPAAQTQNILPFKQYGRLGVRSFWPFFVGVQLHVPPCRTTGSWGYDHSYTVIISIDKRFPSNV